MQRSPKTTKKQLLLESSCEVLHIYIALICNCMTGAILDIQKKTFIKKLIYNNLMKEKLFMATLNSIFPIQKTV